MTFAVLFVSLLFVIFASRLALFFALRRRLTSLSFFFSFTLFYLELAYLRHRPRIRTRGLDLLAALAFFSFWSLFLLAVVMYNLYAGPGTPP